jgi:hypothetical protein
MVELSKIVGTILKDLAQSRAISDKFTRDISVDYASDKILKLFPVPRVEIKEIKISIPFAIKSVEIGPVNLKNTMKPRMKEMSENLSDLFYDRVILNLKNKEKIVKLFNKQQFIWNVQTIFEELIISDEDKFKKILEGEQAPLDILLSESIEKELMKNAKLSREILSAYDKDNLSKMIGSFVTDFNKKILGPEIISVTGNAQINDASVNVGINYSDLAEIPESSVTRIEITANIRNYHWIQSEDADGNATQNLISE